MKKYVLDTNKYSFEPTGRITFTVDLIIQNILVITNVTDGEVIYNFACPGKTGILNRKVLTLEYDTGSMSSTDELLVILQEEGNEIESSLSSIETTNRFSNHSLEFANEQLIEIKNLLKLILS